MLFWILSDLSASKTSACLFPDWYLFAYSIVIVNEEMRFKDDRAGHDCGGVRR